MPLRNFSVITISSFFYVGYLPFAPGTFASICAAYLFYFTRGAVSAPILLALFLMAGFLVSGPAERLFGVKDPPRVVIDEICGMFLSLIFLPSELPVVVTALGLFRILDTIKPYPANKLERFPGSLGIMADDIVAGLYTNAILQVALRLASLRFS